MADRDEPDVSAELAGAQAELARRQGFTDALLETIDVGIISCDPDGHFVISNRRQRELFGFTSQLSGLWMGDLDPHIDVFDADGRRLPPEEYPLMRALAGGDVSAVEVLVGPAGGPYRDVVVRGAQITDPAGHVLGAVAALTDVTAERTAHRALEDEHRRLAEAQRIGQLGSFEHHFPSATWTYSAHLPALWGLDAASMRPDSRAALVHEDDRGYADECWAAACRTGGHHSYEYRIRRHGDDAERVLRTDIEIELDAQGRPVVARGTQLDITDVKRAEHAATRANAFFNAVLTASPDYTLVTDVDSGAIIYGSRDQHVLGIATEELTALGHRAAEVLVHPEDLKRVVAADAAAADLADGTVLEVRYRGKHGDGSWRWLHRRSTPFRRETSGRVVEVLAVVRDVSDLVAAENQLTHAAQHDDLTGLPNRGVLIERLEAALIRSEFDGREVAVLFIDLDDFKNVNDSAGHAAGDAVLLEAARRLTSALRKGDTVARVGGDEFVIVIEPWRRREPSPGSEDTTDALPDLGAGDVALQVANRVLQRFRRPVTVDGIDHVITASVGVSYASVARAAAGKAPTADNLVRAADAAMYLGKSRGKDSVTVDTPA